MSKIRYCLGFVYAQDGTVLLREHQRLGGLNGFGGKIEAGESPVQAMVREFREEAGIETTKEDWVSFHYEGAANYGLYCYAMWEPKDQKIDLVKIGARMYSPRILDQINTAWGVPYMVPMGLYFLESRLEHRPMIA